MYQAKRIPESDFSHLSLDFWNTLLKGSVKPTFQNDLTYLRVWLRHLRKKWNPLILEIRNQDNTVGFVPLMYRNEWRKKIIPYRRVRFLGHDMTDFSTIPTLIHDTDRVVQAALHWLFSSFIRWELLILDDLVEGNPLIFSLKNYLEQNSIFYKYIEGKYYYVDLDRPWEEVRFEMSKKAIRRSVNLAKNRISKAGNWNVIINPKWSIDKITEEAKKIHVKRQNELKRISFYEDDASMDFISEILKYFRELDFLRTYWLEFNDKCIAYLLGFEQDNVLYAWNMAFLPEFSSFFPSKLLIYNVLEKCHSSKLSEFNFMRGEGGYKSDWTSHYRKNIKFCIMNNKTLYGKSILFLERLLKINEL